MIGKTRHLVAVLVGVGVLAGSVPARAQFRGAWLPPPGELQAEVNLVISLNDRWFCGRYLGHCQIGERDVFSDFAATEESRTYSLFAKTEFAPWDHLSLKAELPFHILRYEQRGESGGLLLPELESEGIGDLKLTLRGGTTIGKWAVSGGYGIEFPTGDFSPSAFIIPLGQGTLNHELILEGGRSLWPWDAFLETGMVYRIRQAFEDDFGIRVYWGNELHGQLGGGFRIRGPVWLKARAQAFTSERFSNSIPGDPDGDYRSRLDLVAGVFISRTNFLWEIWGTFPVSGRNTPADPSFGIKFLFRQALRSPPPAPVESLPGPG